MATLCCQFQCLCVASLLTGCCLCLWSSVPSSRHRPVGSVLSGPSQGFLACGWNVPVHTHSALPHPLWQQHLTPATLTGLHTQICSVGQCHKAQRSLRPLERQVSFILLPHPHWVVRILGLIPGSQPWARSAPARRAPLWGTEDFTEDGMRVVSSGGAQPGSLWEHGGSGSPLCLEKCFMGKEVGTFSPFLKGQVLKDKSV